MRSRAQVRTDYAGVLAGVPQLAALGAPFLSSEAQMLTEEETEYSVSLVKHVFEAHLVLQFNCTNTVAEQVLEDVFVALDLGEAVTPIPAPPRLLRFLHARTWLDRQRVVGCRTSLRSRR